MTAPRLQLYTRTGCHLCDELLAAARPIVDRHRASIEKVDIDTDLELLQRYRLDIPVLTMDGEEICRHRLDAEALERALARTTAADAGP